MESSQREARYFATRSLPCDKSRPWLQNAGRFTAPAEEILLGNSRVRKSHQEPWELCLFLARLEAPSRGRLAPCCRSRAIDRRAAGQILAQRVARRRLKRIELGFAQVIASDGAEGATGGVFRMTQTLRRTDFAWEFLRRNEQYRRQVQTGRAEARTWGLQFVADPHDPFGTDAVFWRPDLAPTHVVWLRRAANDEGLRLDQFIDVIAERRTGEGVHVKLRGGLQAYVDGCDPSDPLAAIIPISGSFSAALKGVSDLERVLRGETPSADLTAQQTCRLQRVLKALDAAQARATYRQVAAEIFGEEAVRRYDWRTSSIRDTAIRLVRTGRALSAGGYLKLLGATST